METNNLSLIISACFQVALFSAVPFVWWIITARKSEGFFSWIGLKKPLVKNKKALAVWGLCLVVLFVVLSFVTSVVIDRSITATARFTGEGFKLLAGAFVWGFIATGLSEEILFRGFLGKRLIKKLGLNAGNFIKASVFGIIHGAMFFAQTGIIVAVLLTVLTGFLGWVMGYVNEKHAGGSILPSWLFHGLSNFAGAVFALFIIS